MTQEDYKKSATKIIQENQYMTLATSDSAGNSWASPVAYTYDSDFNFYWVSLPSSSHQKNIEVNPNISFSIFDSHQNWGEGIGLQIEAKVEKVPLSDLPKVSKLYFSRKYPYGDVIGSFGKGLKELLKGKVYHFYKAAPIKIWTADLDAEVDARVEVKL